MPPNKLSRDLISAIDEVVEEIGMSSGSEAANLAVSGLRAKAGNKVFPSIYRLDAQRIWLVAQAGYTGVYDGIGLERGVMARTVKTGETQFVEDSSEVPDYLFAQPGFVSEVTCLDENVIFNVESTAPLEAEVVGPLESFTSFLAERLRADPTLFRFGTVAHALGPMISLNQPEAIAEYAARVTAVRLELDLCQVILDSPLTTATWRHPQTRLTALDVEDLSSIVKEKEDYASWAGPASELSSLWIGGNEAVVVPMHRHGRLVGGLVGTGPSIPGTEILRETLVAISSHTTACLERVILDRRLKRSLTERSRFMGVVSHELRTPLTAIIGFADVLLSNETLDDAERIDFLTAISESSNEMLDLIGDILEVARAETGQLEVRSDEVVDLAEVTVEARRYVQPQAQEAGTEIRVEVPPGTVVRGDRLRVRQIIVNLLSNAVKFTPGGLVDVAASLNGESVSLVVEDNGKGIDSAVMETLFEPFTGHSVTVPGSGSGLGLVISRQLARAMNGDLRLQSDGSGLGARATLTLPHSAS